MLKWFIQKLAGDTSEKRMKTLRPVIQHINAFEPEMEKRSDPQLREISDRLKSAAQGGEGMEKILPEAFALVRETARRAIGLRPFDVQLLGGMILHDGRIAEMKTGEGKTLVATLPAYLNALTGIGVHIVTVNDYLARRDRQWMGPIFERLGCTVGLIQHDEEPVARRAAYSADITYGTNNEFGFDYLRDNMAVSPEYCVQRNLHYAIVDEVDSILIDEARTPLIISGMVEQDLQGYFRANDVAGRLQSDVDFKAEGKTKNVTLTEEGIKKIEKILGIESLYDLTHMEFAHQIIQALRAHHMFRRDVDYIAKEGEIVIVDEFTGRLMVGRRYSDGLHQAIEAKERVQIQQESQTLAAITFQNYFRLYEKLAGMTGTAKTQEEEFWKVYKLEVAVIPTHKKMIRADLPDVVYKTKKMKFQAAADEIEKLHKEGRPVLVGTVSIENSELLSDILRDRRIAHHVLNAKQHEKEAEIIAQAGQKGGATISTNMAGRGTDIVLGEGVAGMGGLHVIGTERHENRRIDNQLRGRSGRQGDPGTTRFYVSLEDDLMKHFGSGRISGLMDRLGIPEDTPIEHGMVTRAIENAQGKVERYYSTIRKQVLEFDDVMNRQRETIYQLRRRLLFGEGVEEKFLEMMDTLAGEMGGNVEEMKADYQKKKEELGEISGEVLRQILLRTIDAKWIDQLHVMDGLREGIGLRAWGQRDPLVEYKMEAFNAFNGMMHSVREDAFNMMMRIQVAEQAPVPVATRPRAPEWVESRDVTATQHKQKIGRNDPCYCGSGKKYKKCHGKAL